MTLDEGVTGMQVGLKEKATAFGAKVGVKAMAALRYGAVAATLTLPALAEGETASITSITSAATTVETFTGSAFSMITGNPLLCAYAASGLVGIGITVFKRLKRASR